MSVILNLLAPRPIPGFLNALWIGRIESFKTPILKRLIQDLPLASETSVSLKIVGNGEDKEKLERYTRTLPSGLEILFLGELEGPELTKEIICSDLGFCMGTSSLDVAKYGIPVVCLDYSFVEIDFAISYRFLYEVEGFTLGRELNFEDNFDGRPLSVLLKQLKREPATIGVRCRRYWEKNHSPRVLNRIVDSFFNSTASIGLLKLNSYHQPDLFTRVVNIIIFFSEKGAHKLTYTNYKIKFEL